jgi:hypothetical protein
MLEIATFLGVWILVFIHIISWFRGENAEGKINLQIHHEFSEAFAAWASEDAKKDKGV